MTVKNNRKLQHRAIDLTEHWLCVGMKVTDRVFGEGYARNHPELVSAFMATAAANFATLTQREIAEAEEVTTISIKAGEQAA